MAKMRWDRANAQKRAQKYGLEIDPSVGADPNKIPKYGGGENNSILKKVLGVREDDDT